MVSVAPAGVFGAPIDYDNTAGFDAEWYMRTNPDLIPAGVDTPAEALSHYMNFGRNEGRAPSEAVNATVQSQAPGVRMLNVASLAEPTTRALYAMSQEPQPVDPRIGQALSDARSSIQGMADPYDPESYKAYMNPFLQDVVNARRADIEQDYQGRRQATREEIAAGGAFGGTALGRAYAGLGEAQNRQLGSELSRLRAQGFSDANQRAMDAYRMQQANRTAQGSQFMNLASNLQGLDQYGRNVAMTGQNRMMAAGDRIQAQNQRMLDSYFGEQAADFNYPMQTNQYLQGVLGSYPTGQSTSGTTPGNMMQGALGGAMLGSQMGNYFGGGQNYQNYLSSGLQGGFNPSNTYFNHTPGAALPWSL